MAYKQLDKNQFVEDATGDVYEWRGETPGMVKVGTAGAKHVNPIPGPGTSGRYRWLQLDNAGTVKSAYWPSGANITDLVFFCKPVAGTAALAGDEHCIIAIDAIDAPAAAAMLTQTESTASDIGWVPINVGEYVRIPLTTALTQGTLSGGIVYAKTVGGIALDLWIGGY